MSWPCEDAVKLEERTVRTGYGPAQAIAATAEIHGAELLTLNVKHFPMAHGLKPAFR